MIFTLLTAVFAASFALHAVKAVPSSKNTAASQLPSKIYGVNLGSWLLIEPWMLPEEWLAMGGEKCDKDCSSCIANEFEFAKAHPDADERMKKHWQTWFTQADVDAMVAAGINAVRIPLGYWIVEPLVDREVEFYARGGIVELARGLRQLKDAGIKVVLDHHALPGVSTPNQMFAGRCTADAQFYTPHNYRRALIWTAVMTALSHLHPDFSSVFSIQAINEPITDATKTPGLGDFYKNFVETIRAVELIHGIDSGADLLRRDGATKSASLFGGVDLSTLKATEAIVKALPELKNQGICNEEVLETLAEAAPILDFVSEQLDMNLELGSLFKHIMEREPLVANFMDMASQYNNPVNPADFANGPQAYDAHLYYSFGGAANADEKSYMTHLCNLDRFEKMEAVGNAPLWIAEWSLATQFEATDEFLFKFADAQKIQYGRCAGWFFWNWKTEVSPLAGKTPRFWSYQEALHRGYLSYNPEELHDPNVCQPYYKDKDTK